MNNNRRDTQFHVNLAKHILLLLVPTAIWIAALVLLLPRQASIPFGIYGLAVIMLLLRFACGAWYFCWTYRTTDQLNTEKIDLPRKPNFKLLLCLFLPFYTIYWTDQSAKRVDRIAKECGLKSNIRTLFDMAATVLGAIAVIYLLLSGSVDFLALTGVAQSAFLIVMAALAVVLLIMIATPILLQAKMNQIAATGIPMQIRGVKPVSWDDMVLYGATDVILMILLLIVGYPIIYVLSCSFSSGIAVSTGQVLLMPVQFSLQGYKIIFNYHSVWVGFGNSIFYTVVGTALNMFLSVLAAYPLSRPNYQGRKLFMKLFTITMVFGAGIIPKYLLMSGLGLTNTRWALILATSISAYNMIIIRTYFQNSIPSELIEAARIDGCSELRTLWSVVLPLSKAVLSVVTLYYAVGHWNSYFGAMLYLRDRDLQPLQIVLRDILAASKIDLTQIDDPELVAQMVGAADLVKYALIVISSAPIIAAYPFVQKFFKKGVMIGSVKG